MFIALAKSEDLVQLYLDFFDYLNGGTRIALPSLEVVLLDIRDFLPQIGGKRRLRYAHVI